MVSFFEIFIALCLIFILFRRPILFFLSRYLTKQFQKAASKQQNAQFKSSFNRQQQSEQHRKGETFISKNDMNQNSHTDGEGEYVDFEEMK